jgi:hypothetical protein
MKEVMSVYTSIVSGEASRLSAPGMFLSVNASIRSRLRAPRRRDGSLPPTNRDAKLMLQRDDSDDKLNRDAAIAAHNGYESWKVRAVVSRQAGSYCLRRRSVYNTILGTRYRYSETGRCAGRANPGGNRTDQRSESARDRGTYTLRQMPRQTTENT